MNSLRMAGATDMKRPCPPGLQAFRRLRTGFCFRETESAAAAWNCRVVEMMFIVFVMVIVVPRLVSTGKIVPDTFRETKKPPSRSRDERCQARGTTPLCYSLTVCNLDLCGSVVVRGLRHSGSGNGEPYPSPSTRGLS